MDFGTIFQEALTAAVGPSAAIYALAAIGLNIHFGYTGLLNFGQVGFMLVGAYGVAVMVSTYDQSMWLGVLVGLLCAVVLALILGIPTLRLRADYLAITTIASAEILRYVYRSSYAEPVTGGVFGLTQFADPFYDLNPYPARTYELVGVDFDHREMWFLTVCWGLVALATLLVSLLFNSPWGRLIRSIREDEDAARSLGKNVYGYKMQSLVLGGVLGALAGVMFAINTQSTQPDAYQPVVTFFLYTLLVMGGAGRVWGPVIGAVIFWFVLQVFDSFIRQATGRDQFLEGVLSGTDVGQMRFVLVGLGLMLLMIYRPQGMLGDRREMVLDARR